jgi:hypothetical protein
MTRRYRVAIVGGGIGAEHNEGFQAPSSEHRPSGTIYWNVRRLKPTTPALRLFDGCLGDPVDDQGLLLLIELRQPPIRLCLLPQLAGDALGRN